MSKEIREPVYRCDYCKKVLSDGVIDKPHLSISFTGGYSGWVAKDKSNRDGKWKHTNRVIGIYQFCGGVCLGHWFNKGRWTSNGVPEE